MAISHSPRAFNKDEVRNLVTYFGWDKYIPYIEIFPGSKITHFVKWVYLWFTDHQYFISRCHSYTSADCEMYIHEFFVVLSRLTSIKPVTKWFILYTSKYYSSGASIRKNETLFTFWSVLNTHQCQQIIDIFQWINLEKDQSITLINTMYLHVMLKNRSSLQYSNIRNINHLSNICTQ